MGDIRLNCQKVIQGSMEFYTFIMNSAVLRKLAYVSSRDAQNPLGYQRVLNEKRLKQIGEYIKKPRATFPNSIIINIEANKARFEPSSNKTEGVLIISDDDKSAWIIDGQHRLYGFSHSEGKEFNLLVSAFIGLGVPEQALIFKIINSEQKGVNPSLIYDLIGLECAPRTGQNVLEYRTGLMPWGRGKGFCHGEAAEVQYRV